MRSNIIHNYAAQFFLVTAGLLTLPFLLERLGAELYAFVAILFTIQSIFSILDGGLSGALAREFALKTSVTNKGSSAKSLLSKAELIFVPLSAIGFAAVFVSSSYLSHNWLKLSSINYAEARHYLIIIGAIASLRLMAGLYRSVLIGFEKQRQLSHLNILLTAARYFFVLPVLDYFGSSGYLYFSYQIAITIIELIILKIYAANVVADKMLLTRRDAVPANDFFNLFYKSAQIWFLTLIWVAATQIDKVILSKIMPLEEFGYFTVVSALASGLLMLGSPVTSAAMPRMSRYFREQSYGDCEKIYFQMTSLLSLVSVPMALTLATAPEHALFIFTNSTLVAMQYSSILIFYSIGSLLLLLSGMTFLLQYSAGNLIANIRQNFLFLVFLVVAMLVMTNLENLRGAAYAWLFSNILLIIYFIQPLNKLRGAGFHGRWLYAALIKPFLISGPSLAIVIYFSPALSTKIESAAWLFFVYASLLVPILVCFYWHKLKQFYHASKNTH